MYNLVFLVAWYDSITLLPVPQHSHSSSFARVWSVWVCVQVTFLIFIMFLKQNRAYWRGKSTVPFKLEAFFFLLILISAFLISACSFGYFGKSYSFSLLTQSNPVFVFLVLHKPAFSSLFLVRDIQETVPDQVK